MAKLVFDFDMSVSRKEDKLVRRPALVGSLEQLFDERYYLENEGYRDQNPDESHARHAPTAHRPVRFHHG
jgi:hypothetical protein